VQERTLADRRGDVTGHVVIEERVQLIRTVSVRGRAVGVPRRFVRVRHQFACVRKRPVYKYSLGGARPPEERFHPSRAGASTHTPIRQTPNR